MIRGSVSNFRFEATTLATLNHAGDTKVLIVESYPLKVKNVAD
jgi:hypothetical protein